MPTSQMNTLPLDANPPDADPHNIVRLAVCILLEYIPVSEACASHSIQGGMHGRKELRTAGEMHAKVGCIAGGKHGRGMHGREHA